MRGDLRPVPEGLRRADHRLHREFQAGHVLDEFADLALLPQELLLIGEVLVLAAAAATEQGADRIDPVGGGLQDLHQVRLREILVVSEDAGADLLAGKGEGDHDHPAGGLLPGGCRQGIATEADAQVGEGHHLELDLLVVGEWNGVEGFMAGHGVR